MAIGDAIKSCVDGLRDDLGTLCTLTVGTADPVSLGKCGYNDLDSSTARELAGDAFFDEIGTRWAMIEVPTDLKPEEQQLITNTLTGDPWVVRRVSKAQAADVVIAYRCLCTLDLSE